MVSSQASQTSVTSCLDYCSPFCKTCCKLLKKHQWTLISPVHWLCLCLGPFEVLYEIQVLAVVLWRCNLKPVEFTKNFPVDSGALQTRPQSLVTANVPTCLVFLSSAPRACLTCRDSPRCDTICLPGLSDKIF